MPNFTKFLTCSILLLSFLLSGESTAQDARFSQFYNAPAMINPAMAGTFDGDYRFSAQYRDQWSSVLGSQPYRTFSAGLEKRFPLGPDDSFSLGIYGLRDDRIGAGALTQNRVKLNASFMKQLTGGRYSAQHFLVAGAQFGGGQNRVKGDALWFSEQYNNNSGQVDLTTDNGEAEINGELSSDLFADFNAGLLWYAVFDQNKSLYAGGSLFHLNQANISLLDDREEPLYRRWVLQAGGELPFSSNLSLLPAAVLMNQGPSSSMTLGANFRYRNHDWNEIAIRAGLWSHLSKGLESSLVSESWIFALILEVERWNIGLSYELNASALEQATNHRGAFELSVVYTHPAKRRYRLACPNF